MFIGKGPRVCFRRTHVEQCLVAWYPSISIFDGHFKHLVFQRIFTVLANLLCLLWRCFVVCAIDNPKAQNIQFVPCVYVSAALFRTAMDTKIVELQRAEKTALEKATRCLPRCTGVPPGSLRCEYRTCFALLGIALLCSTLLCFALLCFALHCFVCFALHCFVSRNLCAALLWGTFA